MQTSFTHEELTKNNSEKINTYLSLNKVTLKYNTEEILKNISLNVEEGQIISILGKSGCGKSTLFQSILGGIAPDSGCIHKTIDSIAYMSQDDLLLPWRTVLDNLLLPFELNPNIPHSEYPKARDHCMQWLRKLKLESCHMQYPSQLSGGMKKRIALLRAFLTHSHLMLLDEPFSALDHFTKVEIYGFFLDLIESRDLAENKKSVLMITHDLNEAILLSDKIIVLGGKPSQIIQEVNIDLPRPRSIDMLLDEQGIKYHKLLNKNIR